MVRQKRSTITCLSALLLSVALSSLIISCDGESQPPLYVQEGARWFLCTKSGIAPTASPNKSSNPTLDQEEAAAGGNNQTSSFRPWTVQNRAAGFVRMGDILYCGINGTGVLEFDLEKEKLDDFTFHENRFLFSGRTIGALFAYDEKLYCHLYRNVTFTTPPPASQPLFLVTLKPGKTSMRAVVPSFQVANPEWEAVEVIPSADDKWYIAWKSVEEEQTRFRYTRFSIEDHTEDEITEDEFRTGYRFSPAEEAPKQLLRYVEDRFGSTEKPRVNGRPAVVHIVVRSEECTGPERYRLGALQTLETQESKFISIKSWKVGSDYYLLRSEAAGDGERAVHIARRWGDPVSFLLPALPDRFAYTDFWTDGERLVASWEEQRFPEVGEAGFVVLPLPFE